MTIRNARYLFTVADIGNSGRQSDGSVYTNSSFGYAIENKRLKLPGDKLRINLINVLSTLSVKMG